MGKTFLLSRPFSFEAGHRLLNYNGACANLHGHSWHGDITIECPFLDALGIGIDYGRLKEMCKEVESTFDHKMILSTEDTELQHVCMDLCSPTVLTQGNPTSENIARMIHHQASYWLHFNGFDKCSVHSVVIHETAKSTCEYR